VLDMSELEEAGPADSPGEDGSPDNGTE